MLCVGIDVAKDKHDCCLWDSENAKPYPVFTIPNSAQGFQQLFDQIKQTADDLDKVKVGLEATGHYSDNIHKNLVERGLSTYLLNPILTSNYKKGITLRKTKTDKLDAESIASMVMNEKNLKAYSVPSYHIEELKSLTRYRFKKVGERSKLLTSVSRLVNILFPELEKCFTSLHLATVHALLEKYPGANRIASCRPVSLGKFLSKNSKGRFGISKAEELINHAKASIGTVSIAKAMELSSTIRTINMFNEEIKEIDAVIKNMLDEMAPPILEIPGIGYPTAAMILAEVGDFKKFSNYNKVLAYAGMSPTTNQSGQKGPHNEKMEKRGSRYLRYALYTAAKQVSKWEPKFKAYLEKKRKTKSYNVAISHVTKKLVRVMHSLQLSGQHYCVD